MDLWVTIVALLASGLLLSLRWRKPKTPNVALTFTHTLRMCVFPSSMEDIHEPIKKKKKKKIKKGIKEPIVEVPQEEQSDSDEEVHISQQPHQEPPQVWGSITLISETEDNGPELIIKELELIRAHFPLQLREISSYTGDRMGSYEILLSDPYGSKEKSEIVIWWKYNKNYPKGSLDIGIKEEYCLSRLQMDIIKGQVELLREGGTDIQSPLLSMLTAIFARMVELGRPEQKVLDPQQLEEYPDQIQEPSNTPEMENPERKELQQRIQEKKPQLETLVNQIFFYPHDLIEAPQWGESMSMEPEKPTKFSTNLRYNKEFIEIRKIGEGGFGRVYLSKNRFDENTYAVKKILLNEMDPNFKKTIKEVTFLSQLNHPNIVRYHQAWTEEIRSIDELISELEIEESEQNELQQQFRKWKHDNLEIEFADNKVVDEDSLEDQLDRMQDISLSSQGIVFGEESHIQEKEKESVKSEHSSDSGSSNESRSPFKILYIAMEYCGQHTLKDWIDQMKTMDKNKIEEERTHIFREILEALVYTHERKIIHRDLKPANIFWDERTRKIKLGDFGVATNLNEDKFGLIKKDFSEDRIDMSDKTKGVGTPIYRAPEQTKSGRYNEKADIYSLGIILFEMYYNFSTRMERQILITQLSKNGIFPTDFKNIEVRKLIKSLVSENPADRPSARSLRLAVRNTYFGQVASTIANPSHFQFRELLSYIFKIHNNSIKTFEYESFHHLDYEFLENIFICHGGSNHHLSPLIPVQDFIFTNKVKVAQKREGKFLLITQEGVVVEVCSNAYHPWIRWLMSTLSKTMPKRLSCIRRYSFAEILQCKENLHAEKRIGVFDLIYPTSYTSSPLEYECEVIRMSVEIHEDFKDTFIEMGHSHFLPLICQQLKINEELFYGILYSDSFHDYENMTLEKKLEELKKYSLDEALCHKIVEFLNITAKDLPELEAKLTSILPKFHEAIVSSISHLRQLARLLNIIDVVNIKYRVGIPPQNCAGIFWRAPRLFGFASLETWQREEIGTIHVEVDMKQIARPVPDVYVWSVGEYLQKDILEIVTMCWDAGLHAQWSKYPRGEKVDNIRVGIILKRGAQKKISVMVKSFQGLQNPSIETSREHFTLDMVYSLLKTEAKTFPKSEFNRSRGLTAKDSKSKD